jgi:hypothetical protein
MARTNPSRTVQVRDVTLDEYDGNLSDLLWGILQECGCETRIPVKKYAYEYETGLISEGSAENVFESCWSSTSVVEWRLMMWGRTLWWRSKCNIEVARQGWWHSHMWADLRRLVGLIWAWSVATLHTTWASWWHGAGPGRHRGCRNYSARPL